MKKNEESEKINDRLFDLASSEYQKLMKISRFIMHNEENLSRVLPQGDEEKPQEKVLSDYRSFLERQVLVLVLQMTLDGLHAREDMQNLVRGSKMEETLRKVFEVWDTTERIEDAVLEDWIREAGEAVAKRQEEMEELLTEGQMKS